MKDIFLSKKMEDVICEYAENHDMTYAEAKKLMLTAFGFLAKKYKVSIERAFAQVDKLDKEKFNIFINEVRKV